MSEPIRRNYDLNGISLAVVAADQAHAAFLDPILAPLAVAAAAAPGWTIRLHSSEAIEPPPADTPRIWHGPLPEGLLSTLVRESDRQVLVVPGHFAMSSVRSARSTDIQVAPAGAKSIGGTAAFWLLEGILAAHSRQLLHGACLVRRATQEAFALFAPSGTGKTTTALALARTGLEFAGDDALVLENAEEGPHLWGIPRKIKVHRRTADLLPWLRPVLRDWTADEQVIGLDALDIVIPLADATRRRAAGAIVLLPPNAVDHRVETIAKADALTQLLTDNVRRAPTGVDADAQAAFTAMARFVGATPTVALSVGPDPGSLTAAAILSAL